MCGIGGMARIDGGVLGTDTDTVLAGIADRLAHRGPDERVLFRDGPVGLAFTRLSLVDPACGSQPLVSDDGALTLIVNGEVYNHRDLAAGLPDTCTLRTGSDCEVLLHLYRQHGLRFLDDVRGMFGLILWDRRNHRLILARDRFGIKPLYFHRNGKRIVLGSETTSLFADPATPRRLDWHKALTTPFVVAAPTYTAGAVTTWFEDIESVPAATILQIDLRDGRTVEHRYWTFPGDLSTDAVTIEDYVDRYRELLVSSVQECATADAELGLFLSGGIDSAAVAAIAAEQVGTMHTFTVLGASTYHADAVHGHQVAQKLGLPNHQVLFPAERVPGVDEWKRLLWLTETPLCGPEIYYKHELHRYAKQARPQLRGMLLGAASDEFNGGYSVGVAGETGWPGYLDGIRSRARMTALCRQPDLAAWWTYCDQPLLTDEAVHDYTGMSIAEPYQIHGEWEYWKIQQYNCWHEDRTAAGSGIEARVPFLDHRLVELVMSVPPHLREALFWNKRILRAAMRGRLPEDTVERPKGHFFYEHGHQHTYRWVLRMLTQDGGSLIEQALAAPEADRLLNRAGMLSTVEHLSTHPDSPQLEILLRVVNLGLLAGMVSDLPGPTKTTPAGPVARAVEVRDWDAQKERLENLVGLWNPVPLTGIPRLSDRVLLLTAPGTPDWYLTIDGGIEYVLSEDEPEILRFLRAIDGSSPLSVILAGLGRTADEIQPIIVDLMDKGIVELAGG